MEQDYNTMAMQNTPRGYSIIDSATGIKQLEARFSENQDVFEPDFNRLAFLAKEGFPFLITASRLFNFGVVSFGLVIAAKDQPEIKRRSVECGYERSGFFQKPDFFKNKLKHSDLTIEEELFFKRGLFKEDYIEVHRTKEGNIYRPVDQESFRQYLSATKKLDD
ncbi:MAG: hypothetical protein K9H64_22510 [Bacteroidales bacterium]|nr:hypothetical protein [Bacteroidales bacterium]MCF8458804.1 hypothetical protein [Bacteroidales bacterium]